MALGVRPKIEGSFLSVLQTLQEATEKNHDHITVKDISGHQITYLEPVKRAIAMSSDLKSHGGVVLCTPVCVLGQPTIDLICSILGIWCAGGIYVPLDHQASDEENAIVISNCNANTCIVSQPHLVNAALQLSLGTVFDSADMCLIEGFGSLDEPASEDIAVVFHVPASNQQPKGIPMTHENIMALVKGMKYYVEAEKPVVLQHNSWTCDLSLLQILLALTAGGTLVLALTFDMSNVSNVIVQQKVTATIAMPSHYATWFQQPLNMLSSCNSCSLHSAMARTYLPLSSGTSLLWISTT
jgi:acyl-CoA synthetase (AMP-forming)/AMP-acid ligase II